MNGVISGKRGVNRSGTMGPSQKSAFNPLPRAIAIDKKWKKVDVGDHVKQYKSALYVIVIWEAC
jgi:hypothetical protein